MRTNLPPTTKLAIFCLLLASLIIVSGAATALATALQIGDKAPVFTLLSTTGERISLNHFKGKKKVLIHFYTINFNPT